MPGPNTWMSEPTPVMKMILSHLPPGKLQLDKLKLKKSAQAAFNPEHGIKPRDIPGSDLVETQEFSIPGRDNKPIKVRSYTPVAASSDQKFPVLTWTHHGGWKMGTLDTDDAQCRYMSVHCNVVVINIDYALVPARFPTALHNVHDVVRWIAENHNAIRVDPSLGFILGGASAGANMSTVVAHLEKNKISAPITGQLLTVGWFMDQAHKDKLDVPQQWVDDMTSLEDNSDAVLIGKDTIQAMLSPDWLNVTDSSDPTFSPCLFPRSSFTGLPPAYIQVAGQDPFRDEGFLYAKLLERSGVAAKVKAFPGVPHAWFEFAQLPETKKFVPDLCDGIKWLQAQRGPRL